MSRFYSEVTTQALQSTQDAIAYSINLPLRILNLREVNNTSQNRILSLIQNEPHETVKANVVLDNILNEINNNLNEKREYLDQNFRPPSNLKASLPLAIRQLSSTADQTKPTKNRDIKATEHLDLIESSFWRTVSSNPVMINDLFRLSPEWRWFELLWFYCNRHKFSSSQKNSISGSINAFGIEGWKYYWIPLCVPDDHFILFCGPIYDATNSRDTESFHTQHGLNILESFSIFHHSLARWGRTGRFSREDMERTLHTRTAQSRKTVQSRLKFAANVLRFLENSSENNQIINSKKPDAASRFARESVLVGRVLQGTDFTLRLKNWRETYNDQKSSIVRFSFRSKVEKLVEHSEIVTKCWMLRDRNKISWEYLSFSSTLSQQQTSKFGLTEISIDDQIQDDFEYLSDVDEKMERWRETAYARKRGVESMRAKLMGDWLNHQYLIMKTVTHDNQHKSQSKPFHEYNLLCGIICDSLHIDLCHIYRFSPHIGSGLVVVQGKSHNPHGWQHDQFNLIESHMHQLGTDDKISFSEKVKQSIVFRCIDSCTTEFYSKDAGTEISWPKECEAPGCVVATPIIVEGRVWGVVEIATLLNRGIDKSTQFALNSFASVLGPYCFSMTFTNNLKQMGKWGRRDLPLKPGGHLIVADNLADHICRISLARSVLILIRNFNIRSMYEIVGWSGPDYIKGDRKSLSINMEDKQDRKLLAGILWQQYIDEKKSGITALLDPKQKDQHYSNENPEYHVLGKSYFSQSNNKSFVKQLEIDNIMQINAFTFDIDSMDQDEDKTNRLFHTMLTRISDGPTGMVLVYHQKFTNRAHWTGVNDVLANRLAQCFEDILIGKLREDARGRLIRHELKHTVRALRNTTLKIQRSGRFFRNIINRWEKAVPTSADNDSTLSLDMTKQELIELSQSSEYLSDLISNTHSVYDQLTSQTESIERGELINFDAYNSVYGNDEDDVIEPYTCISEAIGLARNQYSDAFRSKGLFVNVDLPKRLYLRIRPEYIALLLRNIFENWSKYATNNKEVGVLLSPVYRAGGTKKTYTLRFYNTVTPAPSSEEVQRWMAFGERGIDTNDLPIEGDGIGLFLIQYMLQTRLNIPVKLSIYKRNEESIMGEVRLDWLIDSHWLTMNPEPVING